MAIKLHYETVTPFIVTLQVIGNGKASFELPGKKVVLS